MENYNSIDGFLGNPLEYDGSGEFPPYDSDSKTTGHDPALMGSQPDLVDDFAEYSQRVHEASLVDPETPFSTEVVPDTSFTPHINPAISLSPPDSTTDHTSMGPMASQHGGPLLLVPQYRERRNSIHSDISSAVASDHGSPYVSAMASPFMNPAGEITNLEELTSNFNLTEASNGFANGFAQSSGLAPADEPSLFSPESVSFFDASSQASTAPNTAPSTTAPTSSGNTPEISIDYVGYDEEVSLHRHRQQPVSLFGNSPSVIASPSPSATSSNGTPENPLFQSHGDPLAYNMQGTTDYNGTGDYSGDYSGDMLVAPTQGHSRHRSASDPHRPSFYGTTPALVLPKEESASPNGLSPSGLSPSALSPGPMSPSALSPVASGSAVSNTYLSPDFQGPRRSRSTSAGSHGSSRSRSRSSSSRDYILELASSPQSNRRVQKHPSTFACHLCDKRFTRAYNLRSHLRTHTDERPFVCSVCGKAFARQHDRKRHEALHSGQKKFECKGLLSDGVTEWGCGRKFARADALGRHFRTESGRECIRPLLEEEAREKRNNHGVLSMDGNGVPYGVINEGSSGYPNQQGTAFDPQVPFYGLPAALLQQYPGLLNDQPDLDGDDDDEIY